MTSTQTPRGRLGKEDGHWIVHQFFSPEELRLSPDEYVARHAHLLGNFSFHLFRYDDPVLATWLGRIAQLLQDDAEIERCRRRYLTPVEMDEVHLQSADL